MFRRTIVPVFAAVVVLAVPAAAQAAGLTATFSKSSDWGSGFVADYTIKNTGSTTVNGWRLEFDLPAGEKVTNAWNGVLSSSGTHYVLVNASWNQTIAPEGSADGGFQGTYSGNFTAPQNCALNGQACIGSPPPGPPDTTAPSGPTGVAAGSPTATTIPLHWNASSDNVGVTGYRVYSGSTQVATTTTTSSTVTGLAPSTSYTFTVRAFDAAGNASGPSNAVTASTTAAPAGGLTATFAKSDDWGSGFVGGYTIKNNGGTAVNGWRLEFDLPAGASVTNAWNGVLSSSGSHYVITDVTWNHTIAPGGTANVGFQVSYATPFVAPGNCRLNGQACLGSPHPRLTRPRQAPPPGWRQARRPQPRSRCAGTRRPTTSA